MNRCILINRSMMVTVSNAGFDVAAVKLRQCPAALSSARIVPNMDRGRVSRGRFVGLRLTDGPHNFR